MVANDLLAWATLASLFIFIQVFIERNCLVASGAHHATGANATGAKPFWRKPGCHLVGHTRTISIPGCVKFNLSTNACRGFCMSFSIPAADDIGPASTFDRLGELINDTGGDSGDTGGQNQQRTGNDAPSSASQQGGDQQQQQQQQQQQAGKSKNNSSPDRAGASQLLDMMMEKSKRPKKGADVYDLAIAPIEPPLDDASQVLIHFLAGKDGQSPITGLLGEHGEKRDVISVGQCCNMIETEDVTVNLRCGLNDTKRLVFKSAKTCECFFCKHV